MRTANIRRIAPQLTGKWSKCHLRYDKSIGCQSNLTFAISQQTDFEYFCSIAAYSQ